MTQLYIHTFLFIHSLPLWFIIGYWLQFSALCSRTLLFIHSLYKSVHPLTPTSHSRPQPTPLLLATISLFSESMILLHRQVHLCHVLFYYYFWPLCSAFRILVSQPGSESGPQQRKCQVLSAGPPGNSLCHVLDSTCELYHLLFVFLFLICFT